MAAALIAYKTREATARRRREAQRQRHPVHADARGAGVVVFDVETTSLIDSATPVHDMAVSVASTVQIPSGYAHACGGDAAVTRSTFW